MLAVLLIILHPDSAMDKSEQEIDTMGQYVVLPDLVLFPNCWWTQSWGTMLPIHRNQPAWPSSHGMRPSNQ